MDVKANRHQSKQAVKKLYDTDMAKVNISASSNRQKKIHIHVAPNYGAFSIVGKLQLSKLRRAD